MKGLRECINKELDRYTHGNKEYNLSGAEYDSVKYTNKTHKRAIFT